MDRQCGTVCQQHREIHVVAATVNSLLCGMINNIMAPIRRFRDSESGAVIQEGLAVASIA